MKNFKNFVKIVFLLFVILMIDSSSVSAKVEISDNFSQAYTSYVKSLPDSSSLFKATFVEVYPYYLHPISNLDLKLDKLAKQNFKKGEEVPISGSLKFTFDGQKIIKKLSEDCMKKVNNAEICNVNSEYSISQLNNLGIFVQVWRVDEDSQNSKKGDFLIQEFYLSEGINLKDGQEGNFKSKWKIPEEIKTGKYYLSFYINSEKSFDLNGSPLVTFNAGKTLDFYIPETEGGKSGVEIDKNSLKINGADYYYRNVAPTVSGNQEVVFEGKILNYDPENKDVKIKYSLYRWGQEDPADLLSQKEENMNIEGQSEKPIKFSFKGDKNNSVYNLKIEAVSGRGISTSNLRIVFENYHRGVFRYLGFLRNSNKNFVPFFCIRDAQWSGSFKGSVKLTLLDSAGKEVASWEDEDQINSGNDRCFAPKDRVYLNNLDCSSLKAEIKNNQGVVFDKKTVTFGCEKKEASNFKYSGISNKENSKLISGTSQIKNNRNVFLLMIAMFGAFVFIVFLINKKNQKNEK